MSRQRHKSKRPKIQRKKRIPNRLKEEAVQLRALGHTYNEIANHTKLGYSTVEYIIRDWAPKNPDRVKEARAKVYEEMAGKVSAKAVQAIDNITQDSMTHDRVEQFDAAGRLIGVQHSGPNGLQLATQAGILIDKSLRLQDEAAKMRGEQADTLGPSDFAQLISSIGDRLGRLGELKADINTGEITARVVELTKQVQDSGEIPADYELLDDEE